MPNRVAIIDYGVGNVHSVSQALSFLGYSNVISSDAAAIRQAVAIILPGVGAFGQAVTNLKDIRLIRVLNEEVLINCKPILGICLGMHILGNSSEESPGFNGLGWIDFDVISMPRRYDLKVPHVGWNTLKVDSQIQFFENLEDEPHFYFDHSYYADCSKELTSAWCDYGIDFPAVIAKENIVGVQFHPEKSQNNGLKLFRNFFKHFGVRSC